MIEVADSLAYLRTRFQTLITSPHVMSTIWQAFRPVYVGVPPPWLLCGWKSGSCSYNCCHSESSEGSRMSFVRGASKQEPETFRFPQHDTVNGPGQRPATCY